jgi:hypothetical protein
MNKIEQTLAKWYGAVQPLSADTRKWVATNLWLVALVGVVLMICMLFIFIPILLTALTISSTVSVISPYVPYYENDQGHAWVAFLANTIGCIVGAVLLSFAVGPLRRMKKIGWNLVFWWLIIGMILGIISGVVLYSPLAVFVTVVFIIVGGHFLFETREYFTKRRTH